MSSAAKPCGLSEDAMTTRQLITLLLDHEPDADVLLMIHLDGHPIECSITGVVNRNDINNAKGYRKPAYDIALATTDVFIVEGERLRSGSNAAWDLARRGGR